MEKTMKITVRELMTKIEDIQHIIDELDKMPESRFVKHALMLCNEYIDMLKDTKVDI